MRDQYIQIPPDTKLEACKAKNGVDYYKGRAQLISTEDGAIRSMSTRTLCFDRAYEAGKYVVPFRSIRVNGRDVDFDFPVSLEPYQPKK